jgi:uncharacterized protein YeaO (DUF488 family)
MPNIAVITPPDRLHNLDPSILMIYPSEDLKQQFQTQIQDWDINFNLYLYNQEQTEHDLDWLLTQVKTCDITIFDVDNATKDVRDLASYIIAHSNTYWLTNSAETVYNKLSIKRVYDLSFLTQGALSEQLS